MKDKTNDSAETKTLDYKQSTFFSYLVIIGLVLIMFYTPLDWGGRILRVTTFVCALLTFLTLFSVFSLPKKNFSPYTVNFLLTFGAFILLAGVATTFSLYPRNSYQELINIFIFGCIFFLTIKEVSSINIIKVLVASILVSGVITTILGFYFFLPNMKSSPMIYSTFYQPDVFAGYLLLSLPLAISIFLHAKNWAEAVTYGLSSLLMLTALILTSSRGALIAFICSAAILIWHLVKFPSAVYLKKKLVACLLVVIVFGGLLLSAANFRQASNFTISRFADIFNLKDPNKAGRIAFWKASVQMAVQHPLTGVGLKNYGKVYPRYQESLIYFSNYAHNYYLQTASELGIIVFLLFLWLIGKVMLLLKNTLQKAQKAFLLFKIENVLITKETSISTEHQELVYPVVLGLTAGLTGAIVHNAFDVDWNFLSVPALFWIEVGILLVLSENPELSFTVNRSNEQVGVSLALALLVGILTVGLIFTFPNSFLWLFDQLYLFLKICAYMVAGFNWNILLPILVFGIFAWLIITRGDNLLPTYKERKTVLVSLIVAFFITFSSTMPAFNFYQASIKASDAENYLKKDDVLSAIFCLERATRHDPKYAEYYRRLAELYERKQNLFPKVMENRKNALLCDWYNASHHYLMSKTYLAAKEKDLSLQEIKQAIEFDKINYPSFYSLLGEVYVYFNKIEEAKKTYADALSSYYSGKYGLIEEIPSLRSTVFKKQLATVHLNYGSIFLKENKFQQAHEQFLKAVSLDNENPNAYFNIAVLFFMNKEWEKAVAQFELLSKIKKLSAQEYYLTAVCYKNLGKDEKNIESIQKALEADSSFVPALLDLGMYYYNKGDKGKAKELWEKVLKVDPENKTAKDFLKK